MPPKKVLAFELPDWPGVKCVAQRGDLVSVGVDGTGPGGTRLTVKKRNNEDAETAASRKLKEHAAAAASSAAAVSSSFELPSTQQMDDISDTDGDSNRPDSPVAFGDLDATACQLCYDTDCTPALDLPGGKFCCATCLESSVHADIIRDAAEAQLAARAAAANAAPPKPPALEPRRSIRTAKPVIPIYDLERSGKGQPGWSSYDLGRLDSRHGRVRDETYPELQAARDKLLADYEAARRESSGLAEKLDLVYGRLRDLVKPHGEDLELADCEGAAALILREAIVELADELERSSEVGDTTDPAPDIAGSGATARATECATATPDGTLDATTFPLERWEVEGPVRMEGVSGTEGVLSIGLAYIEWLPSSGASDHPAQQLPLSEVLFAEIAEHDEVTAHNAHTNAKAYHNTHLSSVCHRMPSCEWSWLCT